MVVVENDISNRIFILIANKRRFKILEILRNYRGDSMISENVGNIEQVQALINELNFDKLCFRRKCWYAGKEFIKRKGHNHKERSIQGCKMAKHKTYCPVDDQWVILSSSKAFNYFLTRRDESRCVFEPPTL